MVVSVPLGVGAAVYVSQYAGPRTREIVKPVVELLAGIPSVVLGFFALMVMATLVPGRVRPGVAPQRAGFRAWRCRSPSSR